MQWPSYTYNCCAAWYFLHLLNPRDFMQVLQRTANPPALLCYFDCFILIALWFWWEGVTPGEQHSLGTCTAWGAPAQGPGLWTWLQVACDVGGALTTASLKHSLLVPKTQFMNLQHSTEPVSHAGLPFVYAFGWQICDVPEKRKPVRLHLQLEC